MKPRSLAVLLLMIAMTAAGAVFAQTSKPASSDPIVGTWAINSQQSKLPGPAPKVFIQRYDIRPDGFIVSTRTIVAPDGSPAFEQAVYKHDGKDYEWWDNVSLAEFLASGKRSPKKLSVKFIDAYTLEYVGKEAGKATVTGRSTITKDGKRMTLAGKALGPQEQWIDFVVVFDKQ